MGPWYFALGSAVGAALVCWVGHPTTSRSTIFALNGVVCGLLGALTAAGGGASGPATQAGLGFLGTAAPLTLCVTHFGGVAHRAGLHAVIRRLAAALAVALVSGVGCATLGFVSVQSVRHVVDMTPGAGLGSGASPGGCL